MAHRLPAYSEKRFSEEQDFLELTGGRTSGHLDIRGIQVPFVVIQNQPQLTDPDALAQRYSEALQILTKLGLRWDDPHGDVCFRYTDDAGRERHGSQDG